MTGLGSKPFGSKPYDCVQIDGVLTKQEKIAKSAAFAAVIRQRALAMVHRAKASHIGSCYSMADILAALYSYVLRIDPQNPEDSFRDRFILSKGHAASIVYAALAERGFFAPELLETYCQDGSLFPGHISHKVPGVDFSTGSLGHGLSIGCGVALGAKRNGSPVRTFVMLSDGECDEGSIWEAVLFAPHHRLDNLVVIVDYNKIQSFGTVKDVLELDPFAAKWRAFNWAVLEIDGHDDNEIFDAFEKLPFEQGRPSVIIAHTVKGKGVSFMENKLLWHYKSPSDAEFVAAQAELEQG